MQDYNYTRAKYFPIYAQNRWRLKYCVVTRKNSDVINESNVKISDKIKETNLS